jgi:hypothetical protein
MQNWNPVTEMQLLDASKKSLLVMELVSRSRRGIQEQDEKAFQK